ncbi:conserved hypothetical protein [Burkholderia sp. H160]|nr:conserved hypothetical protein [Burkholderia sp. H160]
MTLNSVRRFASPQALQRHVEEHVAAELARCEAQMTPDQWREHCSWITEDVWMAARLWLETRAREGAL